MQGIEIVIIHKATNQLEEELPIGNYHCLSARHGSRSKKQLMLGLQEEADKVLKK